MAAVAALETPDMLLQEFLDYIVWLITTLIEALSLFGIAV